MSEIDKNTISDDEIAKRTGFDKTYSDRGEEPADDVDETDPEDEVEEDEADDEPTDDSEEDSDDEDEEESPEEGDDDDSDEDDEEDSDDEEDNSKSKKRRTVPYSKLKSTRDKVKNLEQQVQQFADLKDSIKALTDYITESKKSKGTTTEDADDVDAEAEELAKELEADGYDLDQKSLSKILKSAIQLAKKKFGSVPAELQEKLNLLDELSDQKKKNEVETQFNNEWDSAVTKLKKLYPNATDEMLADAKKEMHVLAHSEKFHTYELMDIYHSPKNKKKFDILLKVSPHKKSGEKSKDYKVSTDDGPQRKREAKFEELTPEIMRAREEEEKALNNSAEVVKDYKINSPLR